MMTRDGGARGKMRVVEKDTIQEVPQKKGRPEKKMKDVHIKKEKDLDRRREYDRDDSE